MIDNVLMKELDPALRCTALIDGNTRQCVYRKEPGSEKCIRHSGMSAANRIEKEKIRNYRLARYQRRVNELAESEGVKSLREEIGILRMTLEELINSCETTNDLLMYSTKISAMARDIERLVVSCHRLESSLGFLIDKTTVLNISQQIVHIVSSHIKDEKQLDIITAQIINTISGDFEEFEDSDSDSDSEQEGEEENGRHLSNGQSPSGS